MHAEPGLTIDRRKGTRAATTLRKEPRAKPGASARAASVTSARARQANGRRRVRRRVLRLPLRAAGLLVALERDRDQGGARVDEPRPGGGRLRDDDVRRVAGSAAHDLPGEPPVLELALGEDECFAPDVGHHERQRGGRQLRGARRRDRQLAAGGDADGRHRQRDEDGGKEHEPAHALLFGRNQPRLKRTTGVWGTTAKTRPVTGAGACSAAMTSAGVRMPVAGSSCQVKAVPAKAWNHGSCWGQAVAGWSWRCRCGPVASPVEPTSPTCWPAVRLAPATTCESRTARWQYVQVWPSLVWKVRPMPQRGSGVDQARRTVASLIA